jgi:hypothetical protein
MSQRRGVCRYPRPHHYQYKTTGHRARSMYNAFGMGL